MLPWTLGNWGEQVSLYSCSKIKSKHSPNTFFRKIVSLILGSSFHAGVCSRVNFSDKIAFN